MRPNVYPKFSLVYPGNLPIERKNKRVALSGSRLSTPRSASSTLDAEHRALYGIVTGDRASAQSGLTIIIQQVVAAW